MDNIWILTEERPKESVVKTILELLQSDFNISLNIENVVIKPIIEESIFKFTYIVEGLTSTNFDKVLYDDCDDDINKAGKKRTDDEAKISE